MGYSSKKKKFLAAVIAFQLMAGYALPPAFAATAASEAPDPAPAGSTADMQAGDAKIAELAGRADELEKTVTSNLANSQKDDIERSADTTISKLNEKSKKENEEKKERETKQQQINATTDAEQTAFQVVRDDGTPVTIYKNPCFNSTNEEKCPSTEMRPITTSSGTVWQSLNSMEYTTSDGKDVDAKVLQGMEIQKMQAKMLSSDSSATPDDYAASFVTASALSLQSTKLPAFQKALILAMTYQQAYNDAQQMQREAQADKDKKAKEEAEKKARLYERKTDQDRIQRAQKERDVLKVDDVTGGSSSFNDSSMFMVSISPNLPVNTDGKRVEVTLTPKDKEAAKKGTMSAVITDPATGEVSTIDVTEQYQNAWPIVVESGDGIRPEGERTVTFTFSPTDGSRSKKFTVHYRVSAFVNALSSDTRQAIISSVFSAYANADLVIGTDNDFSVSGKIASASWDADKNVCRIQLADTTGMRDGLTVSVVTSNTTKDKCNASTGKYAAFRKVEALEQDDNSLLLRDVGANGTDTNILMSLDDYNTNVAADALALQNNTVGDKGKDGKSVNGSDSEKVVRMDPDTGRYVYSLAGSLGHDYLLLPHGQMVSIYQDSAEKWHIAKVNGTEYSAKELADISDRSVVNLDKATIDVGDDGIPVIKDEDGVVRSSSSFDSDQFSIENYSLESRIGTSWQDRIPAPLKTLVNVASGNYGGVTA